MHASSTKTRTRALERWGTRAAVCFVAITVLYASPVFIARMVLRVAIADAYVPRSIHRVPGPWGDAYLAVEDAADGYATLYDPFGNEICSPAGGHEGIGDGECPDAMSYRWASTPVWSSEWFDWID